MGSRAVPPGARTILVVDDDDMTREMLRRILEKDGWKVEEASNGRIALDAMLEYTPAVVLLVPKGSRVQRVNCPHSS